MPSEKELRTQQRKRLYELLLIFGVLTELDSASAELELEKLIHYARVEMDAEDISHVEKEIESVIKKIKESK